MDKQKFWCFKNYDLFKGISQKKIKEIATDAQLKECRQSCPIYSPGQSSQHVYIVKRGEVNLYYKKNDKKFVFDTLGPGSVFGNIAMKETSHGHFAEGTPGVCVCLIPIEQFQQILSAHPEVMMRFLQDMSCKISEYQAQFDALQSSADELILHELERLHIKRQQNILGQWLNRPLRITHEKLAERTGLNRVTVTKIMKRLREAKKLTYDSRTGIIELLG
jgi:CRP/FNR family cyclic AMP-dependent transcriptional regulator